MSLVSNPLVSSININRSSTIRTKAVLDFGRFKARATATVTAMATVDNFRRHHDDSSRTQHIEADPGLQRRLSPPGHKLVGRIRLAGMTRRR
jgi:hypothetical protein